MSAPPEESSTAVLTGVANSAQQTIKYVLIGHVNNHFNERVFTKHCHFPCHEFKVHLGQAWSDLSERIQEVHGYVRDYVTLLSRYFSYSYLAS